MGSLYEIDKELYSLLEHEFNETCVDVETGEILTDKVNKLLDDLMEDRNNKLENVALYIKNLDAEAAAIKEEEANLKARRQSKEKKVETLKNYIAASMQFYGDTKLESAKVVLSFRKSQAVEVLNVDVLDKQYIKEKIEYKPDLTAIKKAITAGATVEGAQLVERNNLQIK